MAKLITTALVMKIDDQKGTMLVVTCAGDFWEVPLANPVPTIGQQMEVVDPHMEITANNDGTSLFHKLSQSSEKWLMAAAVCLIFAVIFSVNNFFYNNNEKVPPVAVEKTTEDETPAQATGAYLIALDINPSVELWLDDKFHYIGGQGVNDDGQLLLTEAHVSVGTPLIITIQKLVQTAKQYDYFSLTEENLVMATVVKNCIDTEEDLALIAQAKSQVESTLIMALEAENIATDVSLRTGTKEDVAKAKDEATSVNKLFISEQLAAQGITVDNQQLTEKKVIQLLKETGIPPGQIIKELKQTREKNTGKDNQQQVQEQIKQLKDQLEKEQKREKENEKKPKNVIKGKPPEISKPEVPVPKPVPVPAPKPVPSPKVDSIPGLEKKQQN